MYKMTSTSNCQSYVSLLASFAFGYVRRYLRHWRGATENPGEENAGASKMQGWKMREWVNRHQTAALENARQESMDSQKSY